MQRHNSQTTFSAGLGIATIIVGALFCLQCSGCRQEVAATNENISSQCRVSFITGNGRAFSEICFDDESLINDLILQPMKDAKRDPHPAEYAVTAMLTIISADGAREDIVLFHPWGHYDRGDKYFVADFSGLKAACEQALRDAQARMDLDGREEEQP